MVSRYHHGSMLPVLCFGHPNLTSCFKTPVMTSPVIPSHVVTTSSWDPSSSSSSYISLWLAEPDRWLRPIGSERKVETWETTSDETSWHWADMVTATHSGETLQTKCGIGQQLAQNSWVERSKPNPLDWISGPNFFQHGDWPSILRSSFGVFCYPQTGVTTCPQPLHQFTLACRSSHYDRDSTVPSKYAPDETSQCIETTCHSHRSCTNFWRLLTCWYTPTYLIYPPHLLMRSPDF